MSKNYVTISHEHYEHSKKMFKEDCLRVGMNAGLVVGFITGAGAGIFAHTKYDDSFRLSLSYASYDPIVIKAGVIIHNADMIVTFALAGSVPGIITGCALGAATGYVTATVCNLFRDATRPKSAKNQSNNNYTPK